MAAWLMNPPEQLTERSPTPCCGGRLAVWLVRHTAGVGRDFTYGCSECDTVYTQFSPARLIFVEPEEGGAPA